MFKRLQKTEDEPMQLVYAQDAVPVTHAQDRCAATLPRRFHLTRPSPATVVDVPNGVTAKDRTKLIPNVPIFVERKRRRAQAGEEEHQEAGDAKKLRQTTSDDIGGLVQPTPPPRKRHVAGEAEKQWRQKHRIRSETGNEQVNEHENHKSHELLERMHKLAEEIQDSDRTLSNDVSPSAKIRFKPKAPVRYKDRHPKEPRSSTDDDLDAMDIDSGDDAEYIVDTYIRVPASNVISEENTPSKIGYIVITDEDQELWETYLEEGEDSDKDWNSEEEDENGKASMGVKGLICSHPVAENYYGADYPEDEVDLVDEQDTDPYRYRQGASDEEEYNSDTGAFSDSEHLQRPWKRHPWS